MQSGRAESSMQTNAECQGDGVKVEVGEEAPSMSPLPIPMTPKARPKPKRTAARQQQNIDPSLGLTRVGGKARSRSAATRGQGRQATKCDGEPETEAVDRTKLGNCSRLLARGSVALEKNS